MSFGKHEETALRALAQTHALKSGSHFELLSGRHASVFIDMGKILLQNGNLSELARLLTLEVIERHPESAPPIEMVVAPCGEAHALARAIANEFHPPRAWVVPTHAHDGLFVFDEIAGAQIKNKHVLIVDDVSTSGGTLRRLAYAVHERGGEVVARAALWVRDPRAETEVIGLIHRELTTWDCDTCPLCKQNMPLDRKSPTREIPIQQIL